MFRLKTTETILLFSFLTLITFPLLYRCRFLDDNSLTSWRWVFTDVGMMPIFVYLCFVLLLAAVVSKTVEVEKYPRLSLLLLPWVMVLPLWSAPEMILDSARYFIQAKYISEYGVPFFVREWGKGVEAWTDLPLIPFLYGLLFQSFGEFRWVIQLFNTGLFVLTLFLTYLLGKRLWNHDIGFYGALLLLGIPYLATQVPLMLVDIPTMFFVTLALFTFLKALTDGGPTWITGSALAISSALLSKYSAWPMLSVLPIMAAVEWRAAPRAVLRRAVSTGCLAAALLGVVLMGKYDVMGQQIALLKTFQLGGLKLWQESYLSTFLFQVNPFITVLALVAIVRAVRTKDLRFLMIAWCLILVFVFQVKRIRYILPLFPLLTLMASYGLNSLREPRMKRFVGLAVVASSLVLLLGAYLPFLKTTSMMNLRKAGHYLDAMDSDVVRVTADPQWNSTGNTAAAMALLDLFTRKRLVSAQDWSSSVDRERFQNASLRFSWEMTRPTFYGEGVAERGAPAVVIASVDPPGVLRDRDPERPPLAVREKFTQQSGFFRYQTLVTILEDPVFHAHDATE
ncbi:MAG: glycosyltransferase family 39 protein [bacterium]|nr:glycosyltransferase family 39 protein [bacterium]